MNIQCVDSIPQGIQTDFLRKTFGDVMPDVVVSKGVIYYPAFVMRTDEGYEYFDVPIPFRGQDLSNDVRFRRQCYAELRKYFYGPMIAQMEQQFKGTFSIHQRAVRLAFPSANGANIRIFTPYEAISAMKLAGMYEWAKNLFETNVDVQIYWSSIKQIDLDNADFISFCNELGVTAEQIQTLVNLVLGGGNEQLA